MKKEESDILSKLGREAGFKVPENYFENFASRMSETLPDHEVKPTVKMTPWQRVRPYVYMAAMFAGIWCMMKMFTGGFKNTNASHPYNPEIVAGFQNDENVDNFMLHGDVSEYDILTYEDSVAAESANQAVDASQDVEK